MAAVITARIRRAWPEPYRLVHLTPANSVVALLDWTVVPFPQDGGIPEPVASALSEVLVAKGPVVFHWFGEPTWPAGEAVVLEPAPRPLWVWVLQLFRRSWPGRLVATRSAAAVRGVFDHVWEAVGAPAMLLRPGCEMDASEVAEVAGRRDWRSFRFGLSAYALVAPATEGYAALLAAGTEADFAELLVEVRSAFARAGVAIEG